MLNARKWLCRSLVFIACILILPGSVSSQISDRCSNPIGKFESLTGSVLLKSANGDDYMPVSIETEICPSDYIQVGSRSNATIYHYNGDIQIELSHLASIQMPGAGAKENLIKVILGKFRLSWKRFKQTLFGKEPGLEIETPHIKGNVTGTEFLVQVEKDRTLVAVLEGRIYLENEYGSLSLSRNQSAVTLAGQAPQLRVRVRPRDDVQWIVHYQPLFSPALDPSLPETVQTRALKESLGKLQAGDVAQAFERLNQVPENERDGRFYVYSAALLLGLGNAEEAESDLDRAFSLTPENGEAHALRAVMAIARNDIAQALSDGRKAVLQNPRSSAAKIALSYGLQADLKLEDARDILLQAVENQPDDALAWARLSEIWLSLGYLDKALETAQKAIETGPDLARAHAVLGFARLSKIHISQAKASFEKAISIEPDNPLARLGMGLVKIRDGDLVEGRRDIETAAFLDPTNSIIRSYLGKAYIEEKQNAMAAEQLEMAKEMDPRDPTPYFYDAIRKQTVNRPVDALHDLQKSIELNDNRAVYRSRLLMDQDLAARSAGLGRIYRDLGFEQLALVEGWNSLRFDPGNYSAHRFLADSYSSLPRHDTARVSELLQAQLLQSINITPIQPTLAETSLFILPGTGPDDPAFKEYTPLFNRDGYALQATGIVGSNGILGDEIAHSGIMGRLSYSIGQFHYQTDGFRENNDQDQDIYNVFLQVRLSSNTGIQGEFRSRDIAYGDLDFRFDRENFSPSLRQNEELDSFRFGFHHVFTPNSEIIASVIHSRWDGGAENSSTNMFGLPTDIEINLEDKGWTSEFQHLYRTEGFSFITGLGYFQADRGEEINIDMSIPFEPFSIQEQEIADYTLRHTNLYAYSLFDCLENLTVTLGVSADFYDGEESINQFNPKFGVTWNIGPSTTVRGAVFRALYRTLVSSQTIEPTNVAGFNQLFSGLEGEKAWRYGLGLDHKFSPNHYAGVEVSRRDLEVPASVIPEEPAPMEVELVRADWEEETARGYFYWTPHSTVALSAEYLYERFERSDDIFGTEAIALLKTHRVPFGFGYFHPGGGFAHLKATYVHQKGRFSSSTGNRRNEYVLLPGEDDFGIFDLRIGYRLPERYGLATFEVKNLFDTEFRFQDTDPAHPSIAPERLILFRFTANF